MSSSIGDPLIEVENLTKHFSASSGVFSRSGGVVHAVEDVTLSVRRGETLGIVGESGCGKSTTARLMLKLLEPTAGTIRFDGRDITSLSPRQMRPLRREMQMVFQDPYSSLNPRQTVGQIIGQPFSIHKTEGNTRTLVRELMARCGMNPEHYNRYPHEFSGGQRQRIGVARALALRPKLIVCDEPVSALDVSIQAQILNLLESLQSEFDLTYVFISHDLSVIRQIADRIAVMYLGRVVELVDSETLYDLPRHPYTAAPALGRAARRSRRDGAPAAHRAERRRALAGRAAVGLCVPPALSQGAAPDRRQRRAGRLPRGSAAADRGRERLRPSRHRLLAPARERGRAARRRERLSRS